MASQTVRLSSKDDSFSTFSQLTYDLPHSHIYTSQFYPRSLQTRPTTISEVLICGHESGITVLWRANGASKKPSKDASSGKHKAIARDEDGDDMMMLDGSVSKNNATKSAEPEEQPETTDEEQFASSYTVYLGTAVQHISFPPASILPSDLEMSRDMGYDDEDPMNKLPNNLLQKNFLIVATCADRSVRLITLPRAPPSSNQSTKKWEHVIVLGSGVYGHKEVPSAVSVTIVPSSNSSFPLERLERRSPSGSPGSYSPPRFENSHSWDILIASSSADTNGLILLWRISLHPPARKSPLPVTFKTPSRPTTVFLHAPATSLSFNTSPTSKSRRQHLLVADRKGAIRILDTHTRSWLSSFYTSFSRTSDRRKKVLGAEWLTGGRGIIVLCEDGEWGVWDLEGVLSKLDEASVTGFFIGGIVGETWYNSRKSHVSNHYDEGASDISGRSPSNRALSVVSAGTGTTLRRRRGSSARDMTGGKGFLSVTAIPGSNFFPSTTVLDKGKTTTMGGLQINDETVTFVFGSVVMVIPSLKRFWKVEEAKMQRRSYKSGTLGSGLWNGEDGKGEKEFIVLEGWHCGGATVTGVDVVPPGRRSQDQWSGDSVSTKDGNVARVLLGTGCRIAVVDVKEPTVAAALKDAKALKSAMSNIAGNAAASRRAIMPKEYGQTVPGSSAKGKRKVGFLGDI